MSLILGGLVQTVKCSCWQGRNVTFAYKVVRKPVPGPLSHRKEAPGSEADRVMPESATGSPASGQSQVRHITQEACPATDLEAIVWVECPGWASSGQNTPQR